MRNSDRSIVAIALAATLGVPSLATAQRQHPAALGDLMTAFVQPRHIKLGLAGNEADSNHRSLARRPAAARPENVASVK